MIIRSVDFNDANDDYSQGSERKKNYTTLLSFCSTRDLHLHNCKCNLLNALCFGHASARQSSCLSSTKHLVGKFFLDDDFHHSVSLLAAASIRTASPNAIIRIHLTMFCLSTPPADIRKREGVLYVCSLQS